MRFFKNESKKMKAIKSKSGFLWSFGSLSNDVGKEKS